MATSSTNNTTTAPSTETEMIRANGYTIPPLIESQEALATWMEQNDRIFSHHFFCVKNFYNNAMFKTTIDLRQCIHANGSVIPGPVLSGVAYQCLTNADMIQSMYIAVIVDAGNRNSAQPALEVERVLSRCAQLKFLSITVFARVDGLAEEVSERLKELRDGEGEESRASMLKEVKKRRRAYVSIDVGRMQQERVAVACA